MNSCAASYCTCSPKASCASATLASWPTGGAPIPCRSAFSCFLRGHGRRPTSTLQLPMVRKIFGAVRNVLAPWWSSNDSLPPRCNSVLHLFQSLLPHETTIHITNVLGVFALSVLLCVLAQQISASRPSRSSTLRKLASPTKISRSILPVVRQRADSTGLHPTPPLHPIPIGPASAAGRLRSNGFIESAPEHPATATTSPRSALPIKH